MEKESGVPESVVAPIRHNEASNVVMEAIPEKLAGFPTKVLIFVRGRTP